MQSTRKILSAFFLAMGVFILSACGNGEEEEEITWDADPANFETEEETREHYDGISILAYTGEAANVEIPEKIDGLPVTSIREEAFRDEGLIRIRVPNSLRAIAPFAFEGAAIEEFAFYGDFQGKEEKPIIHTEFYDLMDEHAEACFGEADPDLPTDYEGMRFEDGCPIIEVKEKTEEVHHGDDVYYAYIVVTDLAHYGHPPLRSLSATVFADSDHPSLRVLHLNERIEGLGDFVEISTPALETITVPEENPHMKVEDGVLYDKEKTTVILYPPALEAESFTIPATVKDLHGGVFNDAERLTSFTVAEGNDHFRAVDGVLFSDDMRILGRYPAGKEDAIYEIPVAVESLGPDAFQGVSHLEKLTIGENVEHLGSLGPSHKAIEVFSGMESLEAFAVPADNDFLHAEEGVLFQGDSLLKYPVNRPDETYTVPEGVREIGPAAFRGARLLEHVHIGEDVATIGWYTFQDAVSLETVTFSAEASLGIIPQFAFDNAESLQEVILPSSVTSLGAGAFRDTASLTTLFLPASIENAGAHILKGSQASVHFEADAVPEGFHEDWNPDGLEVHFGATAE